MPTNEDLLFVELALERKLVTQEQVDEMLALQDKLGEMGLAEPLAELMVKKGVLPAKDAESVRVKVSPKGGRQQIKGYRLLERLGRGGMGSVYKAVQVSMDRTVALKVLNPSLVEDDQSTSRLKREAQLVGQLRHPNIVQGLDFGVSNGFHYFAMEYVDGESVKQAIERDGPMKEADALRMVTDVAKALEHAHQEGVVHRDVKPGNILIAKDGTAMLADYGLAKGPLEDAELTRSGVTVGTPQYISPEQAQGPKDVDIRTDVYSLGATLYHMLTGRPPYEGETLAHLIQQVLYDEYAPVRSVRRDLSANVAFLVAKMMARKPAHRYQSPKALLKDLQTIEDGHSVVPAGWEGSIEALAGRRRSRVLTTIIVLILVFGATGAFLVNDHVRRLEREKTEDTVRAAIEAILDSTQPETYSRDIPKLDELFRQFGETEAVGEHLQKLEDLKQQERYVQKGNDLAQLTVAKKGQERFAEALRQIQRFLDVHSEDRAEGEGADWARRRAWELRDIIELKRDQFVADELRVRKKELRQKTPEEALAGLRDTISDLRAQAYLEEEYAEGLSSAEQLKEDLRTSTRNIGKYFTASTQALADGDYARADSLLRQDLARFEENVPLREAMSRLEPEWLSDLRGRFTILGRQIVDANGVEWQETLEEARRRFEEEKAFQSAIDLLTGFGDRSVPAIAEKVGQKREELAETLTGLQATAGDEWERALPRILDFLGDRSWDAAGAELDGLASKLLTHQPNDWEPAWAGAHETLGIARSIEILAMDALDGRKSATLTFGTIRETMLDLAVDRAERSISWSREPGGPRQKSWLRSLSVEDLFREAGVSDGEPQGRFVRAILRLREVGRMSELAAAERELDLIEGWIGEARKLRLLGTFPEHVLGYVREFEQKLQEALLSDELRAEAIFKEAEAARLSERWQEAFDKYDLLLDERKLRETKYVRDREPSIRKRRDEMEQKLPGAKLSEHLRAPVRHIAGNSVKRGNYRVVVSYDFRDRSELERWRYTEGRIDLVEVMAPVSGPELGVAVRRQGLLGFLTPENGTADWLQHHPLRLESPLLYSRDMTITFKARWKQPLALLVSLCGTNVVVLSDDGRKENGRGVHIWQSADLASPARVVPDTLRKTYIDTHPGVLKGDAANRRYFQFEPNRWYRIRFEKREHSAALYVSDRLVHEEEIRSRGAKARDIVIQTWTSCELDDLELRGTVNSEWYHRRVK